MTQNLHPKPKRNRIARGQCGRRLTVDAEPDPSIPSLSSRDRERQFDAAFAPYIVDAIRRLIDKGTFVVDRGRIRLRDEEPQ